MKKLILTVMICVLSLVTMSAHQTMTMDNGEELEVEIVSMGIDEISYKKASNPNGPTYTTRRSNVFFIIYEDGKTEIITPQSAPQPVASNVNAGNVEVASSNVAVADQTVPEINYFPRTTFYPRTSVGFHATPSGYKDECDIDWGGFCWTLDFNVLFPVDRTSATSVGLGFAGLSGGMKMLYTQGGKNHKDKMGDFDATYLTIPIQYWYKGGDWFMFGIGNRMDFLISQKMDGSKIEDMFRVFRDAIVLDGICTIGKFDVGAQLLLNLGSAFKGEGFDWSPTFGFSLTLGYRF